MLLLATAFTSCGKTEETPERGWSVSEIALPEKYKFIGGVLSSDGDFLLNGLFEIDPEHPEIESHDIILRVDALTGESEVEDTGGSDGILKRAEFDGVVCTVDGEFTENNSYESLVLSVGSGGIVSEYDCGELFGVNISSFGYDSNAGGFYIRLIDGTKDEIYVVSNTGAVRIGQTISRVESKREILGAALTDDGLLVFTNEFGGVYLTDFESGSFEKLSLPTGDLNLPRPFALDGYLFGGVVSDRIYGYKRTDGKLTAELICDLSEIGIAGEVNSAANAEGVICLSLYDGMDAQHKYFRLTETEAVEKQILTLAFVGRLNSSENYAVAEFNRTHDNVRLELERYEPEPDAPDSAVERFERDIVAGDLPDMVLSTTDADFANYAGKGLFIDLYGLMDESVKNDLMPFVKSFETSYKGGTGLYYLPLGNRITSLVGRNSDFPDGLTLDIFLDRLENGEDGKILRKMRFDSLVYESVGDFVDTATRKCDFDSKPFRRLAENYKKFGGKIFSTETTDFADGKLLLNEIDIDVKTLVLLKARDGVDDLSVLGYPGRGPEVVPTYYLGVTKDCKDTGTARDFLDLRLSEKYLLYKNSDMYLTRSAFESYIDGQDRYYFFSATGNKYLSFPEKPTGRKLEAIPDQLGAGYLEYELDDDIITIVKDSLKKAQPMNQTEEKAADMILEELESYRAGVNDLDSTIRIINDRVGNFLSEQE